MNTKYRQLESSLKSKYKRFRVFPKEKSKLMRAIAWISKPFNKDFMSDYTTTIGYCVYMPESWIDTETGYQILRHEAIHVQDFDRTYWLPFVLSYTLLLPIVFTFRAYWEFRGYKESMRVELEETGSISDDTIAFIASQFTSSAYGWMCPFKKFITKKLEDARAELLKEIRSI